MLICDFFSILKLLQVYELDGTRTVARMTFNSHSSTGWSIWKQTKHTPHMTTIMKWKGYWQLHLALGAKRTCRAFLPGLWSIGWPNDPSKAHHSSQRPLFLHIVQLDDLGFFSGNSPFFGRFRLLRNMFRRVDVVSAAREVHRCVGTAVTSMGKPHSWEWRPEGLWKEKRHLNTWVWKTSKKWRRWNGAPMRAEFGPHRMRVASRSIASIGTLGVWRSTSRIHD